VVLDCNQTISSLVANCNQNYTRGVMNSRLARSTCPVSRAVDIVGDKWTLMILRDAFEGLSRFS